MNIRRYTTAPERMTLVILLLFALIVVGAKMLSVFVPPTFVPSKTVGPNGLQVSACEDFCLFNGAAYTGSRTRPDGTLECSCEFRALPDGHRPALELPNGG